MTYQYVTDLCNQIDSVHQLAKENLKEAKGKQALYYNCKMKLQLFTMGDQVLLLSQKHNRLQVSWKGPLPHYRKISDQN